MDHIAEKRDVSEIHYGLERKPITIKEAIKIQEIKAAVDKSWDKLKNLPAWDFN